MDQNKVNNLIGLAGAFLMIIAVFCPVVKMPFEGTVSFFGNWGVAGVFVIILALASGTLSYFGKSRYLWLPAFFLGIILCYHLYAQKNSDQYSIGKGFLKLNIQSHFSLEWGWFLLFGAVGLLLLSSILCHKK